MKNEFTSFDIARALDIPMERLRQWMKHGFITPSIPASGQGTKAVFTLDDLCIVEIFNRLIACGLNRHAASKICKSVQIDNDVFIMDVSDLASIAINIKSAKNYVHERVGE